MKVWKRKARLADPGRVVSSRAVDPWFDTKGRRYAVEIRGFCAHAEVNELTEVLDVIEGLTGRVHIVDTKTGDLLCEGTTAEVYDAIVSCTTFPQEEPVPCERAI
ncbi:MAG: hypothetical protein IT366_08130 [Candidatus Hydrogenedentes bacterium]|nr:hypothetical protein [Candidatus Hydrogenedentota bacterium]